MQESKGCVRAKSTSSPGDLIRNPGLMQVSREVSDGESCLEESQILTCSPRRTTASAAATKTAQWKTPAPTAKSNR
jgi:hypothetical protein